jgi:hypothetical protein
MPAAKASDLDSNRTIPKRPAFASAAFPERGTTMKTAAKQYAVTFGLACALALMATPSPLVQTRAGVQGAGTLAQYCAPQYDPADLQRVYCRDRG